MDYFDKLEKTYEPTEQDIQRKLTNKQLEKLCRRTRCRVAMWKWNPLQDIAKLYLESGRLENRSTKFFNKLILKTYRKDKTAFITDEKQQKEQWYTEWKYRKKKAILDLDLWRYDEERRINANTKTRKNNKPAILRPSQEQRSLEQRSQEQRSLEQRSLEQRSQEQRRVKPVTSTQEQNFTQTLLSDVESYNCSAAITDQTRHSLTTLSPQKPPSPNNTSIFNQFQNVESESLTIETLGEGLSEECSHNQSSMSILKLLECPPVLSQPFSQSQPETCAQSTQPILASTLENILFD